MFRQNSTLRKSVFLLTAPLLAAMIACTLFQRPGIPVDTPNAATPNTPFISIPSLHSFVPGDPTATPLGTDITDQNFIEGVAAYNNDKDYEKTISLMSAVIQSNPKLAPPYRYRGLSYWFLEDCNAALNDFEQALSINPDYAAAWAGRGLSHNCLGNDEQALKDYHKALELDPSLAFVHHNLGSYYYYRGEYEKAVEEHSLTIAIDPNRSSAWAARAEAFTQLGRYRECIDDATKALEINPEEWGAYEDRAYCTASFGDHGAALNDYQIFLEHNPDIAQTWYNLGYSQFHSGHVEESVSSYSRTLELDPDYYQAYINRGVSYVKLEKFEDALADYNRALTYGDIPFAYSGRGDAYYGLKQYDLAIDDYETAISMMQGTESSAHSYCMVAMAYFDVGRYQDSLDAAAKSLELNPDCGGQRLYEYQARSYYALGDNEQALEYIDKAMQMGAFVMGYYYRGMIHQEAGEYDEALSDLTYFITLEPNPVTFEKEIADAKARIAELTP